MERSLNSLKAHDGLLKIGFVSNLRGGAYLKELQDALTGTDEEPTAQEIRNHANASEIISLNYSGYEQDSKGKKVEESKAQFKAFNSGYKNASGEDIYGWFEEDPDSDTFRGVNWGTINEIRAYGSIRK